MLTQEENILLTQVGRGTPGGELLRRYWHPVAAAGELTPEKPIKAVKILGEELVVYRDQAGKYGLVGEHCPHRLASLAYGRVDHEGIRCPYQKNPSYRDDIYNEQPRRRGAQAAARMKGRKLPLIDRDRGVHRRRESAALARVLEWRARSGRRDSVRPGQPDRSERQAGAESRQARHPDGPRLSSQRRYGAVQHGASTGRWLHPGQSRAASCDRSCRSIPNEIRLVRKSQSIPSQSPVSPLTSGYDPHSRAR